MARSAARRLGPLSFGLLTAAAPAAAADAIVPPTFDIMAPTPLRDGEIGALARTLAQSTRFRAPPGGSARVSTSFNHVRR
jgi:hypothetical protein